MFNRALGSTLALLLLHTSTLAAAPSSQATQLATNPSDITSKVAVILRDPKLDEFNKGRALGELKAGAIIPLCDSMRDPRNVSAAIYALEEIAISGGPPISDAQR